MQKKLLYVSVNSKPEKISSSKTVARKFINKFLELNPNFVVEEVDLYKEYIPRLRYQHFEKRNSVVGEQNIKQLDDNERKEVDRINKLCDQFVDAHVYVIASPMWNMSFPAPLKEYIDCIVQDGKTIKFDDNGKPSGALGGVTRNMVYIQSSGGNIPWIMKPVMDKGLNYVESIMKFIGINKFEELLVDGTGTTEEERQNAIEKATAKIEDVINSFKI